MYFSEKEKAIIETFYGNLDLFDKSEMLLIWNNGSQIHARFDTCFENDNGLEMEDADYEEYTSFVFQKLHVIGEPPVFITEHDYFCIDYRNFPDEILADGKKIN